MALRLGEIFISKGLVNQEQLEMALAEQRTSGKFLGEVLIQLGFTNEDNLLKVLADQFNSRFVKLEQVAINPQIAKMVPKDLVLEHKFMPIEMRLSVLLIAISNPLDVWPMSVLEKKLNLSEVQTVLATKSDIANCIKKHYGG